MECGIIKKLREAEGQQVGYSTSLIEALEGGEMAGIYEGGNDTHRENNRE